MLVRVATAKDEQGISALLGRSYPTLMKPAYASDVLALALPAMTRANPDLVASGTFYVAENIGSIVGCGGWSLTPPGGGAIVDGLVHARHFAVDPDRSGTGIGRAIFERLSNDARADGAVRIQALSSLNAEPFYKSMGLDRLDMIRVPMGAGILLPVVLMEGPLRPT
ncbi:GNAT family N-acetyltransferase [Gemmobacter denitrificans]|uniref:GNAT family N-acetyltransferase n=1 Tax=Gemmobacter denitrificans TaxID=3123040 RepID=UPI00331303EE